MTQLGFDFRPRARATDPETSRRAAAVTEPGNNELIRLIRSHVYLYGPKTAFEIADALAGNRWQHDTIRSAVSRAGLSTCDFKGVTPGGRPCTLYVLRTETMPSL